MFRFHPERLSFLSPPVPWLVLLFPLSFLCFMVLGCHTSQDLPPAIESQHGATSALHTRVNIIVDTTIEKRLAASRWRAAMVLARLDREDRAALYTLDQNYTEVFSPDQKLPSGFDNTLQTLVQRVKPSPNRGTYPYKAWQQLAQEIPLDPSPTVIIWETDGDEDQETPEAREVTSKAIKTLAALPHLRHVILVGINPEQRKQLREALAPLHGRYIILEKDTKPSQITKLIRGTVQALPEPITNNTTTSYKGGSR